MFVAISEASNYRLHLFVKIGLIFICNKSSSFSMHASNS